MVKHNLAFFFYKNLFFCSKYFLSLRWKNTHQLRLLGGSKMKQKLSRLKISFSGRKSASTLFKLNFHIPKPVFLSVFYCHSKNNISPKRVSLGNFPKKVRVHLFSCRCIIPCFKVEKLLLDYYKINNSNSYNSNRHWKEVRSKTIKMLQISTHFYQLFNPFF